MGQLGNNVTFIGRLTNNIELRETQGGTSVASFTLARNNYNKVGEFYDFVAFGGTANLLAKHFLKGQRVGVNGHLTTNTWKAEDGSTRKKVSIVVDNIEFIESVNDSFKNDNKNDLDETSSGYTEEVDDDDFPF